MEGFYMETCKSFSEQLEEIHNKKLSRSNTAFINHQNNLKIACRNTVTISLLDILEEWNFFKVVVQSGRPVSEENFNPNKEAVVITRENYCYIYDVA
ncbi:hypothetical protein D3C76_1163610 [compost metagenome]